MNTSNKKKELHLPKCTELGFQVLPGKSKAVLVVVSGEAEIFGSDLIPGTKYEFLQIPPETKTVVVSTKMGCKLSLEGACNTKLLQRSLLEQYWIIHENLERQRESAHKNNSRGPVSIAVGPTDSGKSTFCRRLLNYAVRSGGRRPIYVDLDVGQGEISLPGTIGAVLVEKQADYLTGEFCTDKALVYNLGQMHPGSPNTEFYNFLVASLANTIEEKWNDEQLSRSSGMVINTCGWVDGQGYSLLLHAARTFKVDNVFILGDDTKLHDRIRADLLNSPNHNINIVTVPKIGDFKRNTKTRKSDRSERTRKYFFGSTSSPLNVHYFDLKFEELTIFSVITAGQSRNNNFRDSRFNLVKVEDPLQVLNHVLVVTYPSPDGVIKVGQSVAGFVCVVDVNMKKRTLTLLSPEDKSLLPSTYFLLHDLTMNL